MAIRDHVRHGKLQSSVDSLKTSLQTIGINADKREGCGSSYSEFGPNMKGCSIFLNSNQTVFDEQAANDFLNQYINAVKVTNLFRLESVVPKSVVDRENLPFGYVSYSEKGTNGMCTLGYTYAQAKNNINIGFTCNDTSWFTRMFGS
jgi:hypothetical protein